MDPGMPFPDRKVEVVTSTMHKEIIIIHNTSSGSLHPKWSFLFGILGYPVKSDCQSPSTRLVIEVHVVGTVQTWSTRASFWS